MHLLTYDNLEVGDAGGSKVHLDVHNVFVSTTPLLQHNVSPQIIHSQSESVSEGTSVLALPDLLSLAL